MPLVVMRACPYPSVHPPAFGFDRMGKSKLQRSSFYSLLAADDVLAKIIILADDFPQAKHIYPDVEIVVSPVHGNVETFQYQIDLALKRCQKDEEILLLEDDYIWKPKSLSKLFFATHQVPFISPYDHPGHHTEERFKGIAWETKCLGNMKIRKCPSNTLTFATTKEHLEKVKFRMFSYGIKDHEMWQDIGNIWAFTPSLATHCIEGLVDPNVSWRDYL